MAVVAGDDHVGAVPQPVFAEVLHQHADDRVHPPVRLDGAAVFRAVPVRDLVHVDQRQKSEPRLPVPGPGQPRNRLGHHGPVHEVCSPEVLGEEHLRHEGQLRSLAVPVRQSPAHVAADAQRVGIQLEQRLEVRGQVAVESEDCWCDVRTVTLDKQLAAGESGLVHPPETGNVGRAGILACQHRYVRDAGNTGQHGHAPIAVPPAKEAPVDMRQLPGLGQPSQHIRPDTVRQDDYGQLYVRAFHQTLSLLPWAHHRQRIP